MVDGRGLVHFISSIKGSGVNTSSGGVMKSKLLTKIVSGALLGVLGAALVWLLANVVLVDFFYTSEAKTYDWRVTERVVDISPDKIIEDIVIIDIDGRSVSKMGRFHQWRRQNYPEIIKYINEGGALAIGFDIIISDRDIYFPEDDIEFVKATEQAGNVFHAIYFAEADSLNFRHKMTREPAGFEWQKFAYSLPREVTAKLNQEDRFENEFIALLNAARGIGHVNFQGDQDGVVRKTSLFTFFNNHAYPALASRMAMDIMGVDSLSFTLGQDIKLYSEGNLMQEIPIDNDGRMIIHYFGSFKRFRYISFYDVLEKGVGNEFFKDKIVLIGTSLPGLYDLRSAPFSPAFPGVEINANILYTLLTGNFVKQLSAWQGFSILLIIGIVIGIITVFLSPIWSILVIFFAAFIHIIIAFTFYDNQILWIPIVTPILTLLFTFTGVYLYRYITEERGKRFIRDTFSHFVSKSVVDELLANPDKIKLGGEKKVCTVLFSDVVGFTTIAEQLTPEALVALLNQYLTEMTNTVFKYDGMLDKYEGDAVMAVFGAPISHGNHALNSCAAALEMQEQLVRLRQLWTKQGRPQLHARIGINSGPMVVGNMGSENRFDYTVMGDAVNLGARLESANKQYGTFIMIGEATYEITKDQIISRELDLVRVKGKTEPAKVFELIGLKEKGVSEKKQQVITTFVQGFENYLAQKWDDAIANFNETLKINPYDGPARTYLKRCQQFKQYPPGADWDGVFIMTMK
jgi:adenylate cyclase